MLNILRYIWRIYGFLIMFFSLILFSPLLFLFTFNKKTYGAFFFTTSAWTNIFSLLLGWFYSVKKEEKIDYSRNYIIAANHTSFLDIFAVFSLIRKSTVFMGKAEIAKVPLFGIFYRKTSILIKRGSPISAKKAIEKSEEILHEGKNLCMFPEGGIPKDYSLRLGNFKHGAFSLAKDTNTYILPITFIDNKFLYPYNWKKGGAGISRIFFHKPINPEGLTVEELKNKTMRYN